MTPQHRLLLAVLAATDALWLPSRKWGAWSGRLWEMRRDFPRAGVPWNADAVAARTEQGRKAAERELDAATEAGLVIAARIGKERRGGVRLTDTGEAAARGLIAMPTMTQAVAMFDRLRDLAAIGSPVPEVAIAGVHWDAWGHPDTKGPLVDVEEAMLPLLVRGIVASNADGQGRVWYWPTDGAERPDHLAALEAGEELADAANDFYVGQRGAAEAAIRKVEHRSPELGEIPLPVGMGWAGWDQAKYDAEAAEVEA